MINDYDHDGFDKKIMKMFMMTIVDNDLGDYDIN